MARPKKNPTTSNPQGEKPLVDSPIESTVNNQQVNDKSTEDLKVEVEPDIIPIEETQILKIDLEDSGDDTSNPDDEPSNEIQMIKPNVIVLRGFDLGDNHYTPLKKYLIPEEDIPELLEKRKVKLI